MPNFAYVALDARGRETKGMLQVADQSEAVRRLKEMGVFPTRVVEQKARPQNKNSVGVKERASGLRRFNLTISIPGLSGRVKPKTLAAFTRQVATLLEAGMPLLCGLRLLQEQESNYGLKKVISDVSAAVEGGAAFSEALAQHPKVFNHLFVNMVKAGELGAAVDVVLKRLAEFMEKAQKIKGKVIAAMFYPTAVMVVAVAILGVLMVFVVPKFKEIFDGLLNGAPMPAFTMLVLRISEAVKNHTVLTLGAAVGLLALFKICIGTRQGRMIFDRFKLNMPVLRSVISKAAISRFARTLGTLVSSGVPILQALAIVKETSGNVIGSTRCQALILRFKRVSGARRL